MVLLLVVVLDVVPPPVPPVPFVLLPQPIVAASATVMLTIPNPIEPRIRDLRAA
ncbi:Hypothetical protein A7982_09991 [Minicystis rosea]|nr:Hypothetical protein A7982_09991 [Minicystis rosea]